MAASVSEPFLDSRWRQFVPGTHAFGPVWRTYMTRCTTVDKHELSYVVNPNQQVLQASNACQWCDGSIRRPQLRLLVLENVTL